MTLLLWIFVFSSTIIMLRNGQIFEAPCIEEFEMGINAETKDDGFLEAPRDLEATKTCWNEMAVELSRP